MVMVTRGKKLSKGKICFVFLVLKVILRDLRVFTTLMHAMSYGEIKKYITFLF